MVRPVRSTALGLLGLGLVVLLAQSGSAATPGDTNQSLGEPSSDSRPLLDSTNQVVGSLANVGIQTGLPLQAFPHIMLGGFTNSAGWPLVYNPNDLLDTTPPPGSPLDPSAVSDMARYQITMVPPTPASDTRTDMIPALRAANPQLKVFAYVIAYMTWCPGGGYAPDVKYYADVFKTAMRWNTDGLPYSDCPATGPGFLYYTDQNGNSVWPGVNSWANINFVHQDANGNFDVADAYAELIYNDVYATHQYDGVMLDVMCTTVDWVMKSMTGFDVDYQRAGYADMASFNAAWTQGQIEYTQHLRDLLTANGGADFPLIGNCGPSQVNYTSLNGWVRENFPYQNGGTWYTNMFNPGIGYLVDDWKYRQPPFNTVSTYPSDDTSLTSRRRVRFGLGSAALGNGYSVVIHDSLYQSPPPPGEQSLHWWFDEYAVDRQTGRSSQSQNMTGWLGQPRGEVYQMIRSNPNPDLVPTNGFESGTSTGWDFISPGPTSATMTLETGSAPQGTGAAHIHIDALGAASYSIRLNSANAFAVDPAQEYAIAFWAKADHRQTISLVFSHPAFGDNVLLPQTITTEWKRYQVRLKPTKSDSISDLWMEFLETGDVWIDDLHVQQGVTSVYRRDFDNGIVLVNPSDSSQTVALETTYKKILGDQSLVGNVNDGSVVRDGTDYPAVTLQGAAGNNGIGDALFLLNVDVTPPAAVTNLRTQ